MSLFRTSGGKKSQKRMPGDAEGLGLAVAGAMQWAKSRDSTHALFWSTIAEECRRAKCDD